MLRVWVWGGRNVELLGGSIQLNFNRLLNFNGVQRRLPLKSLLKTLLNWPPGFWQWNFKANTIYHQSLAPRAQGPCPLSTAKWDYPRKLSINFLSIVFCIGLLENILLCESIWKQHGWDNWFSMFSSFCDHANSKADTKSLLFSQA